MVDGGTWWCSRVVGAVAYDAMDMLRGLRLRRVHARFIMAFAVWRIPPAEQLLSTSAFRRSASRFRSSSPIFRFAW